MAQRFCPYCRCFKEDERFKPVFHFATQSKRMQCFSCQQTRRRPRNELALEASEESAARRKSIAEATARGKQSKLALSRSGLSNPDIPESEA